MYLSLVGTVLPISVQFLIIVSGCSSTALPTATALVISVVTILVFKIFIAGRTFQLSVFTFNHKAVDTSFETEKLYQIWHNLQFL